MNMAVSLIPVGGEYGLGIFHTELFQGAMGCRLHLLAGRLFAGLPGQCEMDAILYAPTGGAVLIERVEFHDAAGQIGIRLRLDGKAEAGPTDPVNPSFLVGRQLFGIASEGVAPFAEDIPYRACHTAPDLN